MTNTHLQELIAPWFEKIPIETAVIELRKSASGTFSNQGAINSCRWVLVIVFQFPY